MTGDCIQDEKHGIHELECQGPGGQRIHDCKSHIIYDKGSQRDDAKEMMTM